VYDRPVRLLLSIALLGGCDRILGIDGLNGPFDGGSEPTPTTECAAQRVVHLVGGEGALAWFTLEWPVPAVITGFQPAYAYDSPMNVETVGTDAMHPLFVRRLPGGAIWDAAAGTHPEPSAFVAGVNETHTLTPMTTTVSHNVEIVAAGATLQTSLAPRVAVVVIGAVGPYGPANGAPSPTSVMTVDDALALFDASTQMQLKPTPAQLSRYVPMMATMPEIDFATSLAFTANAFRAGVLASIVLPAFDDDPHGAFDTGIATGRANDLAMALDAFYRDLAMGFEATCGHGGMPLSVADNTVMIISGDTPKNSFASAGWADGTGGNANLLYVRSNGFTKSGWFGALTPMGGRTNFDPNTGALSSASNLSSSDAAWAGALYAIARGDDGKVAAFTMAPHAGVIAP
jgi:hypothetical protein